MFHKFLLKVFEQARRILSEVLKGLMNVNFLKSSCGKTWTTRTKKRLLTFWLQSYNSFFFPVLSLNVNKFGLQNWTRIAYSCKIKAVAHSVNIYTVQLFIAHKNSYYNHSLYNLTNCLHVLCSGALTSVLMFMELQ